jgi:putative thioredoxin
VASGVVRDMTPEIVEASEENFTSAVLDRSHRAPVVVDFWAEWCGPCRALGPVLERLATEADGEWLLAKVDVDANPGLAAAFGIQGIPAVRAFRDGQQVAEFVGALPEHQVRSWLNQLGPTPADVAVQEGMELEERGDPIAAADAYRRALSADPGHHQARAALERLELSQRSSLLDESQLRARLKTDPADVDAATGLADLAAAKGDPEAAFRLLLDVVASTDGEARDRARLHLLKLLDTLPADDDRALSTRRALSRVLF